MYSNGGGIGISNRETTQQASLPIDKARGIAGNHKCFVRCICPRCDARHSVYMHWTGRGTPRKYCVNCKPLVAGYDFSSVYESSISTPGQSRKKAHRFEGE